MIGAKNKTLYDKVVDVTVPYLGPAAERFITRQIQMHLHKNPENLTKKDLVKLVDWIKLAMAHLSEDNELVDEFSDRLLNLSKRSPQYESK